MTSNPDLVLQYASLCPEAVFLLAKDSTLCAHVDGQFRKTKLPSRHIYFVTHRPSHVPPIHSGLSLTTLLAQCFPKPVACKRPTPIST